MLEMDADGLNEFLLLAFEGKRPYLVESVTEGSAVVSIDPDMVQTRPGGTVSGPTLMMLADASAYALVLAHIGPVALAVTSSLTINFLHKATPGVVHADAELLRLGKRLAVVEVRMRTGGDLVAQATVTYSIPTARG